MQSQCLFCLTVVVHLTLWWCSAVMALALLHPLKSVGRWSLVVVSMKGINNSFCTCSLAFHFGSGMIKNLNCRLMWIALWRMGLLMTMLKLEKATQRIATTSINRYFPIRNIGINWGLCFVDKKFEYFMYIFMIVDTYEIKIHFSYIYNINKLLQ